MTMQAFSQPVLSFTSPSVQAAVCRCSDCLRSSDYPTTYSWSCVCCPLSSSTPTFLREPPCASAAGSRCSRQPAARGPPQSTAARGSPSDCPASPRSSAGTVLVPPAVACSKYLAGQRFGQQRLWNLRSGSRASKARWPDTRLHGPDRAGGACMLTSCAQLQASIQSLAAGADWRWATCCPSCRAFLCNRRWRKRHVRRCVHQPFCSSTQQAAVRCACLRTALMRLLRSLPGFSGSSAKPCPSGGIAPCGIPNACIAKRQHS